MGVETVQKRLCDARKGAGLTQQGMANGLTAAGFKMSLYSYNKKELGHRRIYVEEGVAMSRLVKRKTEDLFG